MLICSYTGMLEHWSVVTYVHVESVTSEAARHVCMCVCSMRMQVLLHRR